MNCRFPLLLLVFLVLVSPISVSAYDINFIMQDDGSINHIVIAPSVFWDRNCNVSITLFANASHAGSYTLNNKWFSPNAIQILFGNPTYSSNIVCLNQGTGTTTTSLSDFYESGTTTQTSATTTYTWVNVTYGCEFDNNMLFIYDKTNTTDGFGNFPFAYGKMFDTWCGITPTSSTWVVNDTINYLKDGYYTGCGADLDVDVAGASTTCSGGGVAYDYGMIYVTMTPFNSMSSGMVNLSINRQEIITTGGGSCTGGTLASVVYIWDTVTDSTTILSATIPYSANLNLIPNRDYWLFIKGQRHDQRAFGDSCTVTYHYTDYNMTIFAYEPDWLCNDWSECFQGSQYRTCIDVNGISPSRVETRTCFLYPDFTNLRGFEEWYVNNTYTCQRDWTCSIYLASFDIKYPVNWTVSNSIDPVTDISRDFFMEISSDTSTEGTKSLKMWFVPMKEFEPIMDNIPPADSGNTSCGNLTTGKFPEVNTPYNDTLFVATDISFPSPFMDIRFDVKKCENVVQQYGAGHGFCYLLYDPECYGNCNETPQGKYGARLTDADTGEIIYDYTPPHQATVDWKTQYMILDGLIETGKNYTFALAVNPANVFDYNSHCVYFDNVLFTMRTDAVECESRCDPDTYDYYKASLSADGKCSFVLETFSPFCVPSDISDDVGEILEGTSDKNWTCIGTTMFIFDRVTGIWDTIEDAPECIAEQEAAEEEEEMTEPISDISQGIDLFSFLWAPITLFFIFSLLISGILMATVSRMSKSDPSWQVFGISMLCWMLIGTVFIIVPIWIGIVIVAVVSLMVAKELRGYSFGGG